MREAQPADRNRPIALLSDDTLCANCDVSLPYDPAYYDSAPR